MAENIKLADLTAKVKVDTAGLAAAGVKARAITDDMSREGTRATRKLESEGKRAANTIEGAFGKAEGPIKSVGKESDRTTTKVRGLGNESSRTRAKVKGLGDESNKTESKVQKLALASQLGRVGFSGMTTAVLALGPALLPIAGLVAVGALGMGAAFGAAGAAAGVLGAVTVSAFMDIKEAAAAVKTAEKAVANADTVQQRAKATQNLAQANAQLRGSLGSAATAYLRLGSAWEGFKKANAPQTYALIGRGLDLVATIVPKLQPLFSVAAQAAGKFFEPFERAAANGTIDATIAKLTRQAGPAIASLQTIALNLAKTLGHLFEDFAPQGQSFLDWLAKATGRWEQWSAVVSQSDGFQKFMAYLRSNGPVVLSTLSSIGGAIVNLLAAMGPLGGTTLKVVGALANIVNAIPPGVLTPIVAALIGISVALRAIAAYQGLGKQLSSIFGDFSTKVKQLNAESAKTPGGLGRIGNAFSLLAGAVSPVGIALTLGAAALTVWAADKAKARAETEAFTRALEQDSGAIGDNTKQTAVGNLEKAKALDAARRLGISTTDLTDAALGNEEAYARVDAALKKTGAEQNQFGSYANIVRTALEKQRKEFDNAQHSYERTQVALGKVADASQRAAQRGRELADAQTYEAANLAAANKIIDIGALKTETWAQKAGEAKIKLDGLNTAASNLKTTLDLLNGTNIDATQAAISYAEAQATLTKGVKDGGRAFNLNTEAGRTNLGNLLQLATASGNYATARAKQAGSEEAGRQIMIKARTAFLNQAAALGVSRTKALELANAYFKIPPRVITNVVVQYQGKTPTTVQREIDKIHGKNVVVSVTYHTPTGTVTANAMGTRDWRGGWTLVGEQGPELVNLPRGSDIYKNSDTKSMLKQYKAGGTFSGGPMGSAGGTSIVVGAGAVQIILNAGNGGSDGKPAFDMNQIERAVERGLQRVLAAKRAGRRY